MRWHRVRRIMPAYAVTVIVAYAIYHFRNAGPNPGHTWIGFLRNLSLTQIYTDQYMYSYLHQGLTQMWSLAVEAAFYVVLPLLAWLLLAVLCRRRWRPLLLLGGLLLLTAVTPAWLIFVHTVDGLPDGARLWLPTYLVWFVGGMMLAVAGGDGCPLLRVRGATRRGGELLHRLDTDCGGTDDVPVRFGACDMEGGLLRRDRDAGRRAAGAG